MIGEPQKRRIAKEILIAVGICLGGTVASVINSLWVPYSDDQLAWFIGFIIFCYVIRLIAWAVKVLKADKAHSSS